MILVLRIAFCLSLSLALQATSQGSPLRSLNGVLGKAYQTFDALRGYKSSTLKPENEQLVRSIAEEMNIEGFGVKAYAEAFKWQGPHALGNDVFFGDAWFSEWADYPHARRFIIGHELAHVEKSHSVERVLSLYGPAVIGTFFLHKACTALGISPKVDTFFAQQAPWLPSAARSVLGKLFLWNLSKSLSQPIASYVYRKQELEADAYAIEKLAPFYGREALVQGAADFLKKMAGFEHFIREINSTHPHSGDRLRALGLSAKVSEEAGSQITPLLRDRVKIRLDLICCPAKDEEQLVVLTYRFNKNWDRIVQAGRLCSVHATEAQKSVDALGDAQPYLELFRATMNDRKIAEDGKGESAQAELLSSIACAQSEKEVYESAIAQEVAFIAQFLKDCA